MITIACDESGSEGENLTTAKSSNFCHASVAIGQDEADALIQELRKRTSSQAPEFKAKQLLQTKNRSTLLWMLSEDSPVRRQCLMTVVDKSYFVSSKIMDLLVENKAHADGVDLITSRAIRDMAWTLQRLGPIAFAEHDWASLQQGFNSLARLTQRSGQKSTVLEFFDLVERLRLRSARRKVDELVELIWQARSYAMELDSQLDQNPSTVPTMDPLIATLCNAVDYWTAQSPTGGVEVVHDRIAVLTPERVRILIQTLRFPTAEFARFANPPTELVIKLRDSKDDSRIQVADLLAGIGRHAADSAKSSDPDLELLDVVQDLVNEWSLWSDEASWKLLTGRPGLGKL